MSNHKPRQSCIACTGSIPTQNQAPALLYSRGERILTWIVATYCALAVCFFIGREVVRVVTGYVPPVRCQAVQYEFERQVAQGAIAIPLSVVAGGQPGGSCPRTGAAR